MKRAIQAQLRAIPHQGREEALQHRLGALLARWHCWRRVYTTERAYARSGPAPSPEDELEELTMQTIEREIECLPVAVQRALALIARAECMGVECGHCGIEPEALGLLSHRLLAAGVL